MSWFECTGFNGIDFLGPDGTKPPVFGNVLLVTIEANPRRTYVEVQNQGVNVLQLLRDDPGPGGVGYRATSIMVAGSDDDEWPEWASETFKGRLRIYGPCGTDPVCAYEEHKPLIPA
jgi:hypothetical protein